MAKKRAKTDAPKAGLIPVVDRLVRYRLQLDLSQPDFADLMQIPVTTLQRWEQGRVKPDKTAAALLAQVLDAKKAPK